MKTLLLHYNSYLLQILNREKNQHAAGLMSAKIEGKLNEANQYCVREIKSLNGHLFEGMVKNSLRLSCLAQIYQYNQHMKTSQNFYQKRRIGRYKTLGAEPIALSKVSFIETVREKMVTVLSVDDEFSTLPIQSPTVNTPIKVRNKTDQDQSYLTSEFLQDWNRHRTNKKETYSKLRNTLVKQFPSFRSKYPAGDLESESLPSSQEKKFARATNSANQIRTSQCSANNRQRKQQQFKIPNAFYSRSKKKCFISYFSKNDTHIMSNKVQNIENSEAIPQLSFHSYMKKNETKKFLRVNRIKGFNMIQKKEQILNLEKEGSKEYEKLKRYLEDAIEICKKK